jgi:hypothetical protein
MSTPQILESEQQDRTNDFETAGKVEEPLPDADFVEQDDLKKSIGMQFARS